MLLTKWKTIQKSHIIWIVYATHSDLNMTSDIKMLMQPAHSKHLPLMYKYLPPSLYDHPVFTGLSKIGYKPNYLKLTKLPRMHWTLTPHEAGISTPLALRRTTSEIQFNRFEILPLSELYNFAIGSFMYRQINHLSPKVIDNFKFSSEVHNYNTRNVHSAHTMYTRTKKIVSSVFILGAKFWT